MLSIVEIDADERIVGGRLVRSRRIEAAFAELDARYLAGEAAAHSHTWSLIAAGLRRAQPARVPPTTPDWVNIDHRRVTMYAPGDLLANIRAPWLGPRLRPHASTSRPRIGSSNFGAVVTQRGMGPRKKASTPSGERSTS